MAGVSRVAARRIVEQVRSSPATRVKVAVSDTDGVLRGKYLHKEKFVSAAESGFGFCNVVFGWDSNDQCYMERVLRPKTLIKLGLWLIPRQTG